MTIRITRMSPTTIGRGLRRATTATTGRVATTRRVATARLSLFSFVGGKAEQSIVCKTFGFWTVFTTKSTCPRASRLRFTVEFIALAAGTNLTKSMLLCKFYHFVNTHFEPGFAHTQVWPDRPLRVWMFSTTTWAGPVFTAQKVILSISILILLFTRHSNTHVA